MSVFDDVQQTMRRVFVDLGGDEQVALSPTLLAVRTFDRFNSESVDIRIEWSSVEHLKQMARKMLASKYGHDGEENEVYQSDMFSGQLQDRYPIPRAKGEDPVYKPRDLLTVDEMDWNIKQLRKSADARLRHADALQLFRDSLYVTQ